MYTLTREARVPYSARQMFELVNAVRDYPLFLPLCTKSHVLSESDSEMMASLEVVWKGIHKNFTTHNQLIPFKRIEMRLVEGPIKQMNGTWLFNEIEPHACHVILNVTFELTGGFVRSE